jgi:hypothetical protein
MLKLNKDWILVSEPNVTNQEQATIEIEQITR